MHHAHRKCTSSWIDIGCTRPLRSHWGVISKHFHTHKRIAAISPAASTIVQMLNSLLAKMPAASPTTVYVRGAQNIWWCRPPPSVPSFLSKKAQHTYDNTVVPTATLPPVRNAATVNIVKISRFPLQAVTITPNLFTCREKPSEYDIYPHNFLANPQIYAILT
jgi:hypothetical protein